MREQTGLFRIPESHHFRLINQKAGMIFGEPMQTTVRIGTSGWTYADWKGSFYPPGLPQRRWLEHYAQCFDTVEVNASFYHIPKESTALSWCRRTPEGFLFVLKLSRLITHVRRLADCDREIEWFFSSIEPLRPKLGCVLIQLPPSFLPTPQTLDTFLGRLPEGHRYTMELRSDRFPDEGLAALLRARRVGICINDYRGTMGPAVVTADVVYLRFHGWKRRFAGSYPDDILGKWAGHIRQWALGGKQVFAFFNNDVAAVAPGDASRLKELVRGGPG